MIPRLRRPDPEPTFRDVLGRVVFTWSAVFAGCAGGAILGHSLAIPDGADVVWRPDTTWTAPAAPTTD